MTETTEQKLHRDVSELLIAKTKQHCTINAADEAAILALPSRTKTLSAGEDVVCQGEQPTTAVLVTAGMLGRYHTLPGGERQYLSFHIRGDMPDVQSLFLTVMDHSLCALNSASIAMFPHEDLRAAFASRPSVGYALWRLTLVDAAIFRQAITNIGARSSLARTAHFLCEQAYRAEQAGLLMGNACSLPLNQTEIGQALGLSVVSANRNIQKLRSENLIELRSGKLEIRDWLGLQSLSGFDPLYLHAVEAR
jgi:CRP-like cAMP-binding protein